jgi:hypothetical protein
MSLQRIRQRDFAAMYPERRPMIIVDAAADWPARTWTPDSLSSRLADKDVVVSVSSQAKFDYSAARSRDEAIAFSTTRVRFGDAAAMIAEARPGRHAYVMQQSLHDNFPELLADVQLPPWIENPTAVNLWFGAQTVTPLHHDNSNNCFVQLHGEKEFTLFSPDDTKYLYSFPLDAGMGHVSQLDPDSFDPAVFELFSRATPIRFTLTPGEMLYMPGFWWHQVKSPGVSISVNAWWECDAEQWARSPNSLRSLYGQYEVDRLASVKAEALTPNELTFASGAEVLLGFRHRWGAALLAVAAFDEYLAKKRVRLGIPGSAGCRVLDLPSDLERACDALGARGASGERENRIARHIAGMASELSLGNEVDVDLAATAWLVEAVQSLG